MEEIEAVSLEKVGVVRDTFLSRAATSSSSLLDPRDISRVKTDTLWLRRFIAHAENNIETACTLLWDCCVWRKEFGANDLTSTSLDPTLLSKGTLFIRGQDKWGKKLLIFKAKNHTKGSLPLETLQKFIVYFFDRIERESESDQISIIFDMKDTGWNNMDMDFVKYLITLLKTYYPYFVNYLIIFEMPWLLNAAWKIIKGWLPPKFVDRVKFQDRKNLGEFIDKKYQLGEWGGDDNYTYSFEPEKKKVDKKGGGVVGGGDDNAGASPVAPMGGPAPAKKPKQLQFSEETTSSRMSTPVSSSSCELAEVGERLLFRPEGTDEYVAEFSVRNKSSSGPIAVKVKTTTPDRYRVRPIVSVVPVNAEVVITVTTHPGVLSSSISRDRFQVQVIACQGVSSDKEELSSLFKLTPPETYKVGVAVEPREGEDLHSSNNNNVKGQMLSLNDERLKKGLEELEAKVAERVSEQIAAQVRKGRRQVVGVVLTTFVAFFAALFVLLESYNKKRCGG